MAPPPTPIAIIAAVTVALCSLYVLTNRRRAVAHSKGKTLTENKRKRNGIVGAIGNTHLIRINSLSDATGCEILAKAEFLNPGGSVKDRVAVKIIEEALESGQLSHGGVVTEGSAGSTAISLATVAPAYGCKCHVVIPDDAAIEKVSISAGLLMNDSIWVGFDLKRVKSEFIRKGNGSAGQPGPSQILEALGATVERVRPVSITHKDHYVNIARRRASEANELRLNYKNQTNTDTNGYLSEKEKGNTMFSGEYKGGFFADQFENLANYRAHYEGTGHEIWEQTGGKLHAFVAAAGTGGTVAGVSCFLKEKDAGIKCYLVDPPGSGLFNKVTRGVMYTREEAEGKRLKNPFDTVTEGIGINRLTENFKMAQLDGAFRGTDIEAVEMSRFLLQNDGLFIGSSSAMNCVGAMRVSELLGPGHTIVTILCDSGMRHLSKFCNPGYLSQHGLTPSAKGLEFLHHK